MVIITIFYNKPPAIQLFIHTAFTITISPLPVLRHPPLQLSIYILRPCCRHLARRHALLGNVIHSILQQ